MYQYDVVFIGTGHASWHAGMMLVQAGKRVALVEKDMVAGTCTNYGCNAKFLLESPFEFLDGLYRYEKAGIAKAGEISWEKLMAYKKEEIGSYEPFSEAMFKQAGMDIIKGFGSLIDEHTVSVDGQKMTADYIVLATGQRPAQLNIPGNEYFHDSRDFLDLDSLPSRMTFIGAGIISLEFATMAAKMGVEVHVVEFAERALAAYPATYVSTVVNKMIAEGVSFYFEQAVTSAEKVTDAYVITTASGLKIETDYIIDATGRVSNIEELGIEALGIEADRTGIRVNEYMQTAVPNIFASGDVVSKDIPRLTPTAAFESEYIARYILGQKRAIQYPAVPNIVFTMPRIAQVGMTVAEAEVNSERYKVVRIPFAQRLKFQTKLETEADFTLIIDQNKHLVGAALLSQEAGEMINLLTLIINQKLTAKDLDQMIFAFPATTYALLSHVKAALA